MNSVIGSGEGPPPSYEDTGFYTEVVEIDYNPEQISYEALVDAFFMAHNETSRPFHQRILSLILYRTEKEHEISVQKLNQLRQSLLEGERIYTEIKPFDVFYRAESIHQLKSLKAEVSLYQELLLMFQSEENLQNSILASKLNGLIYGYGQLEDAEHILDQSGLSQASKDRIIAIIKSRK